jgi:hypothetical protein
MEMNQALTAKQVYDNIGRGLVLTRKKVTSGVVCQLVLPPTHAKYVIDTNKVVEVSETVASEAINSGLMGRLTEQRNSNKLGWREIGFTDPECEYWVMIQ